MPDDPQGSDGHPNPPSKEEKSRNNKKSPAKIKKEKLDRAEKRKQGLVKPWRGPVTPVEERKYVTRGAPPKPRKQEEIEADNSRHRAIQKKFQQERQAMPPGTTRHSSYPHPTTLRWIGETRTDRGIGEPAIQFFANAGV